MSRHSFQCRTVLEVAAVAATVPADAPAAPAAAAVVVVVAVVVVAAVSAVSVVVVVVAVDAVAAAGVDRRLNDAVPSVYPVIGYGDWPHCPRKRRRTAHRRWANPLPLNMANR